MADSKPAKITASNLFSNTINETMLAENRTSYRKPRHILKLSNEFTGPFRTNWLYLSALAYANLRQDPSTILPYQPDILTVDDCIPNESTFECIWTVSEDISQYRSWLSASTCIISMSGATYGGKSQILEIIDNHTIKLRYRYFNYISTESVQLVPMLPGKVSSCTMHPRGIEAELEFDPDLVYGPGTLYNAGARYTADYQNGIRS